MTDLEDVPYVPLAAVQYFTQVTLQLSVTKRHTDVRYVMTVRHTELHVTWRHARSFDEYRKLQHRLLKKLQHGHFCDADCPWLYGFLKSYFPKRRLFTVSSASVVEERKQTLERFFAALYGFLTEKKNLSCSIVMTVFADELVEFIYGNALQQFGFENPYKSTVREMDMMQCSRGLNAKWKEPATPLNLHLLEPELEQQQYNRHSSLTNSCRESITDSNIVNDLNIGNCGICGSPLCGVAYGNSSPTLSSDTTLLLEEDKMNNSNRSASSTEVGVPFSRTRNNSSNKNSGPPWLGTLATNGSGGSGSANSVSGTRRRKSASRRCAARYYLTTLSCSHQFHDECIVPKLNEALKCPTCGRTQTNH
ncbi:unnamed protein product [Peronospora farinosa]|uniref:PX domain-containing protein n=1 Tax=Peronospora farinosa TaxID=134698 RepID=A0ABN8C3B2_9STRA|nr:unnamed protein product [Peronospora farinosa]